jgi:UDP-N-acetyl-D-galactosamine dehydrogenase
LDELKKGIDVTHEVSQDELNSVENIIFTSNIKELKNSNFFIITVPTPITLNKQPDLTALKKASELVAKVLKKGDIVVYESTVYPGATEDDCIPVLETYSGLKFNVDFFVGYSPERVNPGDKFNRISNIVKITSGSTQQVADCVDELYRQIITAGTHKAESIKVAEAAKIIENAQRDLNIALINEFAIIFNILGLDTEAVLQAAGTKWNFLPFRPGLVGGHCIGIDPYYLTHKAKSIGYFPNIILAGRALNDSMGSYVALQLIKAMVKKSIQIKGGRILIMGFTFKENCPDIRNTRIIDIVRVLVDSGLMVDVYDPLVKTREAFLEYGIILIDSIEQRLYDAILIAVGHDSFKSMGSKVIHSFGKVVHVLYDLKYILPRNAVDLRL